MMTRCLATPARPSPPAPRLAIKARKHARRHAKVIKQDAAEIAQAPRQITFTPVTLFARHRARFQHHQLLPLQPPHEIDALHERQRTETAEPVVKVARDEESLIAIRQSKQLAAQAHQPFDKARHETVVVEREAEGRRGLVAPSAINAPPEALRLFGPARLE